MSRCARKACSSRRRSQAAGFTLLELVLVILLFVFMSGLVVTRFDSLTGWKQRGDVRKLLDTWEFLYVQALSRSTGYQLRINLDRNSYRIFREVVQSGDTVRQVDYLANLRTQSEQERREAEQLEQSLTLEEEFEQEDLRQSQDLETLFYQQMFADPEGELRLGVPLEFPRLAEEQQLDAGIDIRDVHTARGVQTEGTAYVRFAPRGAAEFAVIHFSMGEEIYTAMMNPSTGKVHFEKGDRQFEWLLDDNAQQ